MWEQTSKTMIISPIISEVSWSQWPTSLLLETWTLRRRTWLINMAIIWRNVLYSAARKSAINLWLIWMWRLVMTGRLPSKARIPVLSSIRLSVFRGLSQTYSVAVRISCRTWKYVYPIRKSVILRTYFWPFRLMRWSMEFLLPSPAVLTPIWSRNVPNHGKPDLTLCSSRTVWGWTDLFISHALIISSSSVPFLPLPVISRKLSTVVV